MSLGGELLGEKTKEIIMIVFEGIVNRNNGDLSWRRGRRRRRRKKKNNEE